MMKREHRGRLRRVISLLTALLMLTAWLPLAAATPQDWTELQIELTWPNADGTQGSSLALPIEGMEYGFWAYVPAEALNQLTINLSHPGHAYFFIPESGSLLTEVVPVSTTVDDTSFVLIQAAEGDQTEAYYLYISTVTEEPPTVTPEPTP
ncbi:MAG: hypothetical protein IJQ88_04980, partial [Clostridia bacterium]|nr:hypothetical protein [Clostridia bacterium]